MKKSYIIKSVARKGQNTPKSSFIFVLYGEHRKYHEYPEYWVQMWKSNKQRCWYHLFIKCNCVENDETVNISWLVKDVLAMGLLPTVWLFWNVVAHPVIAPKWYDIILEDMMEIIMK